MKELNETIKNILLEHKNQAYAIGNEKRYGLSLGDDDYKKVTGVDLSTLKLEHGDKNVYGQVIYWKSDDEAIELKYETIIDDEAQDSLSGVIVAPDVKEDYLELFSTNDSNSIDSFLGKHDIKDVLEKIYDDYNEDFCNYLDNLDVSAFPDGVKESCASNYISDNPTSSCRDAMSYMSSYDVKDVLKDMIDEL